MPPLPSNMADWDFLQNKQNERSHSSRFCIVMSGKARSGAKMIRGSKRMVQTEVPKSLTIDGQDTHFALSLPHHILLRTNCKKQKSAFFSQKKFLEIKHSCALPASAVSKMGLKSHLVPVGTHPISSGGGYCRIEFRLHLD